MAKHIKNEEVASGVLLARKRGIVTREEVHAIFKEMHLKLKEFSALERTDSFTEDQECDIKSIAFLANYINHPKVVVDDTIDLTLDIPHEWWSSIRFKVEGKRYSVAFGVYYNDGIGSDPFEMYATKSGRRLPYTAVDAIWNNGYPIIDAMLGGEVDDCNINQLRANAEEHGGNVRDILLYAIQNLEALIEDPKELFDSFELMSIKDVVEHHGRKSAHVDRTPTVSDNCAWGVRQQYGDRTWSDLTNVVARNNVDCLKITPIDLVLDYGINQYSKIASGTNIEEIFDTVTERGWFVDDEGYVVAIIPTKMGKVAVRFDRVSVKEIILPNVLITFFNVNGTTSIAQLADIVFGKTNMDLIDSRVDRALGMMEHLNALA